jgi:hypothetical protein
MSAIETHLAELAAQWHQDAATRRRMSAGDVGADILDYCAGTLLETLREAAEADEELSVAAYAALQHKSVSTVRRWCQLGMIRARKVGREYLVRRGEPAPRFEALSA